jgi:PTS system nitrogen regulatory IIA component
MHFGATLRLLRLDSGLSLRDLARRLGVSSTYLSRVENGLDSTPTPERLEAMARELGMPATVLMDLAHRVSPLVVDYVERVPEAGSLFLEIAHRRLEPGQIAELRALLDERFPPGRAAARPPRSRISDLLTADRIVLQLRCSGMEDVLDVAVARFASTSLMCDPSTIANALRKREAEVSSAIGGGVAVPCAYVPGAPPAAALVTLARPMRYDTPDRTPLRLVIVLLGSTQAGDRLLNLADIARLSARGLVDQLTQIDSPGEALSRLARLEGRSGGEDRIRGRV